MPTKPKWAQLADVIRQQIASGELAPGDKLPSTSQLRKEHGVSAGVVNHAMIVLKTEGLVEGVHGLGVFVTERAEG
ncbi:winged helix-turn-helix domain-containing protein [Micromonospora sp. B11E3]|uniref:winged helix-turn-helix domain-containing protein n=1 Tax=Micromonospora sp. B11E3 TaxID=3153562 RepID=UPI00325C8831